MALVSVSRWKYKPKQEDTLMHYLIYIVLGIFSCFAFCDSQEVPANVQSGGWTSGGGELIRDQNNPWFLSNIQRVSYCIRVDETNFSLSKSTIEQRVDEAIQFWKKEFASARNFSEVKVGTQNFEYNEDCSQADIAFQFGYLTTEQYEYIGNPRSHVGITVRTQYDKKYLKGRGFVYISPDSGPLAIDIEKNTQNMWAAGDGYMLQWILIHELGHVFGIPHDPSSKFMDAAFPSDTVIEYAGDRLPIQRNLPWTYFRFVGGDELKNAQCINGMGRPIPESGRAPYYKFFAVPILDYKSCFSFSVSKDNVLKVYTKNYDNDFEWVGKRLLGTAKLKRVYPGWGKIQTGVTVYVTDQQVVFGKDDLGNANYPIIRLYEKEPETLMHGVYKSLDGKVEKQLSINANVNGVIRISGVMDGVLFPDLSLDFRNRD